MSATLRPAPTCASYAAGAFDALDAFLTPIVAASTVGPADFAEYDVEDVVEGWTEVGAGAWATASADGDVIGDRIG